MLLSLPRLNSCNMNVLKLKFLIEDRKITVIFFRHFLQLSRKLLAPRFLTVASLSIKLYVHLAFFLL